MEAAAHHRPLAPCRSNGLLRALIVAVGVGLAPGAAAQSDVEMSDISGDPDQPRRHFRLRQPARLENSEAERIYAIALPSLTEGYGRSGDAVARAYRGWRRFNTAPYLSSTHGNHYVNNYGNDRAEAYGRYEDAGRLPEGAIIAKDSFSVTESGGILLGPLFVMEKMQKGFSPVSGDWRYSMVTPQGELLGRTNGPGAERVHYCIACHLAREAYDHLYFLPAEVR